MMPRKTYSAEIVRAEMREAETEANIQKAVLKCLHAHGYIAMRLNSGSMKVGNRFFRAYSVESLGSAGAPDILAWKDNRFLMLELKDATGKLSDSQEKFHSFAASRGVQVYVVRGVADVETLILGEK